MSNRKSLEFFFFSLDKISFLSFSAKSKFLISMIYFYKFDFNNKCIINDKQLFILKWCFYFLRKI